MSDAVATAIEVDAMSKAFGSTAAVDDACLRVEQGAIVALVGPSGSGKTTLLRLIAGFERPDAGSVRIGGREVAGERAWVEPEERRVGMVFQHGALFPHLTVAANAGFGAARPERAAECLELVDLAARAAPKPTLAATSRCGKSAPCWKTMPILRRSGSTHSPSSATVRPPMRTRPASGRSKPAIMRSSVVLPEPLGPSSATIWPWSTRREAPSTALRAPKERCRCSASMALGSLTAVNSDARGRKGGS